MPPNRQDAMPKTHQGAGRGDQVLLWRSVGEKGPRGEQRGFQRTEEEVLKAKKIR